MKDRLLIDIVIPVYNKEEYLGELLKLLLSRQDLYDKIILVDDCSKDGSIHLIKEFEEQYPHKILAVFQETNQGPHYARIRGANLSNKEFVMFMDADDLIHLEGLDAFLKTSIAWSNFGICFGNTAKVYEKNIDQVTYISSSIIKELNKPLDLLVIEKPTMSGIIVRNDVVKLMSVGECAWGEDVIFYVKSLLSYRFIYKEETIGIYRIMEGTRGTSGGSLSKRLSFIRLLYSVLPFKSSFSNIAFFIQTSMRTILAWGIKKIR